jgi:multiple sugar transport system permease protein
VNRKRENIAGFLFLAPALTIFCTLVLFPVLFSGVLAFTDWNFLSGLKGIRFVGLRNFQDLAKDTLFRYALRNTVIYAVTTVPTTIALALTLAYALNRQRVLKRTLRLMYFTPYISSTVALAAVFKYLFRDDGPINMVLAKFGVQELPRWLSSASLNRIPIILLLIWTGIGFQLLIYMAALQDIPESLYEAAEIDGATEVQKFLRITIPYLSPTTFYLAILRIIAVFKVFTSINIITYGTTARSNTSMVVRIYSTAFGSYDFGYASAMAWVLFVIILLITLIQFVLEKRWVHYDN